MKVLVVSDTHGRHENFREAVRRVKPQKVLHLGDVAGYEDEIESIANCPVEMVKGNCDFGGRAADTRVVTLGKHKVFMTHGHGYGVGSGLLRLCLAAKEQDCDVALFGHLHEPYIDYAYQGMVTGSPGSIAEPRQYPKKHTYMVINVDDKGDLSFEMHALEDDEEKWS